MRRAVLFDFKKPKPRAPQLGLNNPQFEERTANLAGTIVTASRFATWEREAVLLGLFRAFLSRYSADIFTGAD